jgi:hypothetical protein
MSLPLSFLLTAGQVLEIVEDHASTGAIGEGPSKARAGSVRGIPSSDLADFRSIVRDANQGELVHCPWTQAQTITFVCVRERTDNCEPLFTDPRDDFTGIDQDEWSRIVD